MNEISENTLNEELNKLIMVKIQFTKLYSTEYNMEIQNLERRNSEYALCESQHELESQTQQLLMANNWADQTQRERKQLCIELEMKSHIKNATQEIRIEGTLLSGRNAAKQRRLEEFTAQQDQ